MRVKLLSASIVLIALLSGCTTAPVELDAQILSTLGDETQLKTAKSVASKRLIPLKAAQGRYTISKHDEPVEWRMSPDQGMWRSELVDRHVSLLTMSDRGAILLHEETDDGEAVRITYEPPLTLLPAAIAPGRVHSAGPVKMTVRTLNGKRVRDRGQCSIKAELLGTRSIGGIQCFVLRITRSIDLKMAKVRVEIVAAYEPDRGLVAEHIVRRLRPFGLFETVSEETMLRKSR